jgi:threonyl-tRNA synthetase
MKFVIFSKYIIFIRDAPVTVGHRSSVHRPPATGHRPPVSPVHRSVGAPYHRFTGPSVDWWAVHRHWCILNIYEAFFDRNKRFQELLIDSAIPMEINILFRSPSNF